MDNASTAAHAMSSSVAAGRSRINAAMRGRHSASRVFKTEWAITGLQVAPTPPCSRLHLSSSGSAESFHRHVAVVCVISWSGLFHAAPVDMRGIIEQRRSQSQPSQVVAALLRARFGRAITGKHVLLHDDPAGVAVVPQGVNDGAKIHDAGAELAEQLRTDGGQIAKALFARQVGGPEIAILEVHVPDAIEVILQDLQRIAAAIDDVTG